jgi:hypothetical protein
VRPTKLLILLLACSAFLAELLAPSGRAGRLSFINGPVSSQPAFVTHWVNADFSHPRTSNDPIWGGDGGPVEIRVGSAAPPSNAGYQFLNVADRTLQIRRLLGYGDGPRPRSRAVSQAAGAGSATPIASMTEAGSNAATAALVPPQSGLAQAARKDSKK